MHVTAVAESEMKAAAREGKKPASLEVPLEIVPIDALAAAKGFPIQLQSTVRRDAKEMLQDGTFSGIVRFQLAKRGDPISDQVSFGDEGLGITPPQTTDASGHVNRVPTLRVVGGDVVHLKYEDPQTKQTTDWKVRLLSDGRLELLDPSFTAQSDTIHLGGKFNLRVVDPDRDRSDALDTVAGAGRGGLRRQAHAHAHRDAAALGRVRDQLSAGIHRRDASLTASSRRCRPTRATNST